MHSFPKLSSGSMRVLNDPTQGYSLPDQALIMFPATLGLEFSTTMIQFLGDQEQRWVNHVGLFRAVLEFHDLNGYDVSVLRDFFELVRGGHVDSLLLDTFDITIAGLTYSYCCFDQDTFPASVDQKETYSFELRIRQLRPN